MADYIDREKIIESIKKDCLEQVYYTKEDVIDCIKSAISEDVAPLVHGTWLDFRGRPQCFNCKAVWPEDYYQHNYCPKCGAKMDAE